MSKRLLVIDEESNAIDLCMRCQWDGWDVKMWDKPYKNGDVRRAGEGLIDKISDFDSIKRKWLDWADLIYMPGNGNYVDMLEPYRVLGYPIYACNAAAVRWELDRAVGQKVMKSAGLSVIPSREFTDYDAAIAYTKTRGCAMVSKPSGDGKDKSLTYVADSAADLVYMLERWKSDPKYAATVKDGFILQDKVSGCEMGVSGWFGPGGWCEYWEEDFEFKKLMDGDLGVNTGEQGTLTKFVRPSKLADIVLTPLTAQLKAIGYVGCINVNCMIDSDGMPWPLEFTMRDGWPATHNQMSLHRGDPAQWMLDLVNGKDTRDVNYDDVSISVVVSIPDYPYSKLTHKETCGIPVYCANDREHLHFCEVMAGEAPCQVGNDTVTMPCLVTAGDYVYIATGTGETITGARRSAYAAVKKVKIPNSPSYRLDIGKGRLVKTLPEIQSLGYASGFTY